MQLTVITMMGSACSGMSCGRRINDDGGRLPRMRTTVIARLRGSRGLFCSSRRRAEPRRSLGIRWGGQASSVGALAASGGDGGVRSREGERVEEDRVRGRSGCGAREVRGISRGSGKGQAGGGRGACARTAATRPSSWQRRKTTGEGQVGWASHLGRQVRSRWASLSLCFPFFICFCFLFLSLFSDLAKILNHFKTS